MTKLNKTTWLLLVVGVVLTVLVCVNGSQIIEDYVAPISPHHNSEQHPRILHKRQADEDSVGKKKGKVAKRSKATALPAAAGSSTTKAMTTTEAPDGPKLPTTGKPSSEIPTTTKKPDDKMTTMNPENADDIRFNQLVKDQQKEKSLIEEAERAFKGWSMWLDSHNGRTLNRYRSQHLIRTVGLIARRMRYQKSSPPPRVAYNSDEPQLHNLGYIP